MRVRITGGDRFNSYPSVTPTQRGAILLVVAGCLSGFIYLLQQFVRRSMGGESLPGRILLCVTLALYLLYLMVKICMLPTSGISSRVEDKNETYACKDL